METFIAYALLLLGLALPFPVSANDTLESEATTPDVWKPPTRHKGWPGPKLLVPLTSITLQSFRDGDASDGNMTRWHQETAQRDKWVAYLASFATWCGTPGKWPFLPLFVWKYVDESAVRYRLVDGWHRYMAARIAGIRIAEVVVHPDSVGGTSPPPGESCSTSYGCIDAMATLPQEFHEEPKEGWPSPAPITSKDKCVR